MIRLAAQVACLRHHGLTLFNVMVVALSRGIQPLQQRVHPMWEYNGANDSTRTLRGEFHNRRTLAMMLALMFKGEEADFLKEPMFRLFFFSQTCPGSKS